MIKVVWSSVGSAISAMEEANKTSSKQSKSVSSNKKAEKTSALNSLGSMLKQIEAQKQTLEQSNKQSQLNQEDKKMSQQNKNKGQNFKQAETPKQADFYQKKKQHYFDEIIERFYQESVEFKKSEIKRIAKEILDNKGLYYVGKNKEFLLDSHNGYIWYVVDKQNYHDCDSYQLKYSGLHSNDWQTPKYSDLETFTRRSNNPWRKGNGYQLFGLDYWLCRYNGRMSATNLYYSSYMDEYGYGSGYVIAVNDIIANNLHNFISYCIDNELPIISTSGKQNNLIASYLELEFKDDVLSPLDYNRCRLPELENQWFTDVHKGLWEAYGLPENRLNELGIRARDPKRDIRAGNVGIDFGTSSTVVAYTDDNNRAKLLRIGVDDFYSEPQPEHYENPTMLEFVDFPKFLKAWQSVAYQPFVNWDDVRCSHEAQLNFRHNDSNQAVVASILGKIKQWALRQNNDVRLRITDQINEFEYELEPLVLRNPVKGKMLEVGKNDVFDPIELYAWFLGLNINWRGRGIFLNYYMTFPVAYPKDVKEKILAAFRRGLMRSLPQTLAEDGEVMEKFSVEECATEPAAYIAVAMNAHKIEPTNEGVAYGVFDFGGGTTDFDFGYYRWANEQEEALGLEEVFEHLEAAGDKFLGGENLLENLAYIVFRHNLNICREKRISFTRPLDAEDFAGSELLLEKTQAASTNTLMLMSKLRAYWEKGEINKNGIERIDLISRDDERVSCELRLPLEELDTYLNNRIAQGVESFFFAMKKAFGKNLPRKIHVLLAGNSSRSRRVTDTFGLLPNEDEKNDEVSTARYQRTKSLLENIFKEYCPEIMVYAPLNAELGNESVPTAKTGVALGILRICDADKVKVINRAPSADSGEAPFAHYVGKIRRRKFEAGINRSDAYNEWREIGVVSERGIFNLFHTQSNLAHSGDMEEGHQELKIKRVNFPLESASQKVFARAVAPHKIEICTAVDADNIAKDNLQELDLE